MGIEKFIEKYNLNLELTFFDLEYEDNISNWAGNTDDGKNSGGYVIENSAGKQKAGVSKFLQSGSHKRI